MKYLFQGDSITDCGRGDHKNPCATGAGYVRLLEAELTAMGECEVMNTGVTGDKVTNLLVRWKQDCLNLEPDVLTILIGVNDVWNEVSRHYGVDAALYEEVYRILLRETRAALPATRIILMGSYVTHGYVTDPEWDTFQREVGLRREITHRLAEEFGLEYVDLQQAFDEAQQKYPAQHWSWDGVHPTAAGHWVIARAWKKVFRMGIKTGEGNRS